MIEKKTNVMQCKPGGAHVDPRIGFHELQQIVDGG
jgi:hypothetical protein